MKPWGVTGSPGRATITASIILLGHFSGAAPLSYAPCRASSHASASKCQALVVPKANMRRRFGSGMGRGCLRFGTIIPGELPIDYEKTLVHDPVSTADETRSPFQLALRPPNLSRG